MLLLVAPSGMTDSPDPYKWVILSPDGFAYDATGEEIEEFAMNEPGLWFVSLAVTYQHENEDGGQYIAHSNTLYRVNANPDFIFADGFDCRTPFARWSNNEGGPENAE